MAETRSGAGHRRGNTSDAGPVEPLAPHPGLKRDDEVAPESERTPLRQRANPALADAHLGVVDADGNEVDLAAVRGDAQMTTVKLTQDVWEEFYYPGAHPDDPRAKGKRLLWAAGQTVNVKALDDIEQRQKMLREDAERRQSGENAEKQEG